MSALTNGNCLNGAEFPLNVGCVREEYPRAKAPADGESAAIASRYDLLRRTIESEIIPRLMLTCAPEPDACVLSEHLGYPPGITTIDEFTRLLLDGNAEQVALHVRNLLAGGASPQAVLLNLFAPAAQRLGQMWSDDERSFAEVTIAMGALQQALRVVTAEDRATAASSVSSGRKVVLTPCCGEQHSFAVQVLEAFFVRRGWQVEALLRYDHQQLVRLIKKNRVDVVALSISQESLLDQLASDIQSLRQRCSQSLVVLVGGRIFHGRPELVSRIGADATAVDAGSAVVIVDRLVPDSVTA